MFSELFEPAPYMRPFLNVGFPFDILTGTYYTGKDGESICNGGVQHFVGVAGGGNLFKSTILHWLHLKVCANYIRNKGLVYDTEPPSCTRARYTELATTISRELAKQMVDKLLMTDITKVVGNVFFAKFKEAVEKKLAGGKDAWGTTPFLDEDGKNIKTLWPTTTEIDSLSMMTLDVVDKILEENEIGESGANIEAMKGMAAKTQMLIQIPKLTSSSNTYMLMSAHTGRTYQLDPRAPTPKQLSFMKQDQKMKNVPEKFSFLTNTLWEALTASPLINRTTKAPEYPRGPEDAMSGDTDLMLVTIRNLRNKSGPTGMPFELIVSQSEGFLQELTALNYLKNYERFGLGGHDKSYYLEIYPECKLQRTTVRGKINLDPKLCRALCITGELLQIQQVWKRLPEEFKCTPKQLYEDLIALGYDWDQLLSETRGHWIYKEDEANEPKHFLSTKDLLMMRIGKYQPKWAKLVKPATDAKVVVLPKEGLADGKKESFDLGVVA